MNAPETHQDTLPPPHEANVARISAQTATVLLLFTIAFTAMMAGVYELTKPTLEATALDAKRRLIAEVLPADSYDNDLLADSIELPPVAALNLSDSTRVYRARRGGAPAALVFEAAALNGYSGEIRLILAVLADHRLAAVRVTAHKETPGLGDYIDPKKDKNRQRPWISQFDLRGFGETPQDKWRVKKDGGIFDQHVGATISARAVTNATGSALDWATRHAPALYALPAGARFEEKSQ